MMELCDLTSFFEVVSYNGGCQDDVEDYEVQHLLNEFPRDRRHCSSVGKNFDLVLACKENFTLTHVVIRGLMNATCPIRNGIVWISDEKPDIKYEEEFRDVVDWQGVKENKPEPLFLFEVEYETMQSVTTLKKCATGKYLHIKFTRSHHVDPNIEEDLCNIDIGTIGFVGVLESNGSLPEDYEVGLIPNNLDLLRIMFVAENVNPFHSDLLPQIDSHYCCILFSNNAHVREILGQKVKSYSSKLNFFYTQEEIEFVFNNTECLSGAIADEIGIKHECLAIVHITGETKMTAFVMSVSKPFGEITEEDIELFLSNFNSNSLPVYHKSGPVCDEPVNGVYSIVANNLEEFVSNNSAVLLVVPDKYFYRSWIIRLQKIVTLLDKNNSKFGLMLANENYLDPLVTKNSQKFPILKWFLNNTERLYEGGCNLVSLLNFFGEKNDEIDSMEREIVMEEKNVYKNCIVLSSNEEFVSLKESTKKLLVVNFSTAWCGPCKKIAPVLGDFSKSFSNVQFIKVDCDKFSDIAESHEVSCYPTFVFFNNAVEVQRVEGADPAQLEKLINKFMY